MAVNHQVILAEKPRGKLAPENFQFAEAEIPKPADGEVLVKARYVSLDAANRAWMQGVTYRAGAGAGEVMAGGSLAEVVESRVGHLAPGDLVFADTGWQEYAAVAPPSTSTSCRRWSRRPICSASTASPA